MRPGIYGSRIRATAGVLRFPGPGTGNDQLAANTSLPTADVVLGQSDFVTGSLASNASPTNTAVLGVPLGVAFDSSGSMYVLDSLLSRLYFTPSSGNAFQTGQSAARILGLVPAPSSGQPSYPNQYSIGTPNQPPSQGIFVVANQLYVCDSVSNRIVYYDLPANWPAATTAIPSPTILGVIGQHDLFSGQVNRGQVEPDRDHVERAGGRSVAQRGNLDRGLLEQSSGGVLVNERRGCHPAGGATGFSVLRREPD